MAARDHTGERFGRLTVLGMAGKAGRVWLCECRCDCGAQLTVRASNLRTGNTSSCGCLQRERTRASAPKNRRHGLTGTTTHDIWVGMLQRCHNPKSRDFRNYGARGITVCERWHLFDNFLADMGLRPAGLSIDRVDNDGNYEPGNCRWATAIQQANNRRTLTQIHAANLEARR